MGLRTLPRCSLPCWKEVRLRPRRASFSLKAGCIDGLRFSGDFLGNLPADRIADALLRYDRLCGEDKALARKAAAAIAKKAEWKHFFKYYHKAYEIALKKKNIRIDELQNPRLL